MKENTHSNRTKFVLAQNNMDYGFIKPCRYEEGTSYARQIDRLFSHSFFDIRDISVKFMQKYSDDERDELFEEINHGTGILTANEHLHAYMYCFGLMHAAKLNRAFREIPYSFFKQIKHGIFVKSLQPLFTFYKKNSENFCEDVAKERETIKSLQSGKDALFTQSELCSLAIAFILLVSSFIDDIKTSKDNNGKYFKYIKDKKRAEELTNVDFTKLDLTDVLNKLGLDAYHIIMQKHFNALYNPNGMHMKRRTLKKLAMIHQNFHAFFEISENAVDKLETVIANDITLNHATDKYLAIILEGITIESLSMITGYSVEKWKKIIGSVMSLNNFEVIDYACGQGIATLCFANCLEDNYLSTGITKIILIDPSIAALSRAALVCHKVCPNAQIDTIASEFDDLESDLIPTTNVPRAHLLSNILDMTCYDLNHLAQVINKVKSKGDLFICVDPWYHDRKLDGRQRKLMRLLNGKEIYHDAFNAYQLQKDKSWTAYITIFRV